VRNSDAGKRSPFTRIAAAGFETHAYLLLHSLPGRCLPVQLSPFKWGIEDIFLARAIADSNKIESRSAKPSTQIRMNIFLRYIHQRISHSTASTPAPNRSGS